MAKKKEVLSKSKSKKTAVKKTSVKKPPVKKSTTEKSIKKLSAKDSGNKKIEKKKDASHLLLDAVIEGIKEVKGRSVTLLDLRKIKNRVCDFYVVCHADSNTQVNAIADSVELVVKKQTGERPFHSEGFQNAEWILIDYVTVVTHIFQTEARYFYNLESLWADAEITKIED